MTNPEKKPTTGFDERSLEYGERSFLLRRVPAEFGMGYSFLRVASG